MRDILICYLVWSISFSYKIYYALFSVDLMLRFKILCLRAITLI